MFRIVKQAGLLLAALLLSPAVFAQLDTAVFEAATAEKASMIETMERLVGIESGSGDREGLEQIAAMIADELTALGGDTELLEVGDDVYPMFDTPDQLGPMVHARFTGTGDKKILLIAHMDTVYLRGMLAQQPFRVDGDRAYGLGISDDKQGVALIIHTIAMLRALAFDDYGTLTVLINGDEEISSPGSRATLTRLGAEHDVVLSAEPTRIDNDSLSLATSGIGAVTMSVKGRASHAGAAPELGRNALYEMAHQLLQLDDLSDPDVGLKVNWTLAQVGTKRNVIPADAVATADVRMLRLEDFERLESRIEERISNRLIPDTEISLRFENRRPPLQANDASRALAAHGQNIYNELGMSLVVNDQAEGGGTDAAFAALETDAPVIERFGLQGFGAHSSNDEYVLLSSIEPRLYLLARMIMDVSTGVAPEVK
ncbi:glutamate carboxypeptidase [Pseudohongiella acticola]|jgi:glutamate carboxypeptidase|uniref:Glutamate carboxypeptidase n=1 Tax=Pseudohongiella acticola TaxID=1524254 RepID=A0A1E8CM78_9GAMM|nr:M20/M25/M40 family metallo-hydrolase [Pseudohongiella acticola]OFE13503.1 glutamate carboxypeptidase [Pseudohongiella acticola]